MTPRQREVLLESIKHWEENVEVAKKGGVPDTLGSACSCCREYSVYQHDEELCRGCPVFQDTGRIGCGGTPYTAADLAVYRYRNKKYYWPTELCDKRQQEMVDACQAELDYLKSLLDRDTEQNNAE